MTLDSSLAKFKCYGYQTVQSRHGIKLLLNIYIEYIRKEYHISHILSSEKEIDEFFRSIGAPSWNLKFIPSSSGSCRVERFHDAWIIKEWLEKEK